MHGTLDFLTSTGWLRGELAAALESVRAWLAHGGLPNFVRPSTLAQIAATFELTAFEADLLLLCAAVECDAGIAAAVAQAQGDPARVHPEWGFALERLAGGHWSALAPDAALRYWQLIVPGQGPTLLATPLRIDERILHHIVGLDTIDAALLGLLTPLPDVTPLVATHAAQVEKIVAWWDKDRSAGPAHLIGTDEQTRLAIAAAVCAGLEWRGFHCPLNALSSVPREFDQLWRLWQREVALTAAVLLVDADAADTPAEQARLERILTRCRGPIFVCNRQRWPLRGRSHLVCHIETPSREEQSALWDIELQGAGSEEAQRVSEHFDFSPGAIRGAAALLRSRAAPSLWAACVEHARVRLEGLAERLTPQADWNALVLPHAWLNLLRLIVAQVRCRAQVHGDWQLERRGSGITALFSGPSGTGKSLSAEVIARELNVDLCRVDLSQVVSKYIGETEKNIAQVCAAAEESGAVLLFDECDALFGKRSEVKDSHDRHANIEVSYLLQRMETYKGLAILTTNFADNIDPAFLRRIRFIIKFQLPERAEREAIWRNAFPPRVPLDRLNYEALSQLQVSGGAIHNIAVLATFLAADRGTAVTMPMLAEAAQIECAKNDRTLRPSEVEQWA